MRTSTTRRSSPSRARTSPGSKRLAEVGGGKLLPSRDFAADNPFERDRRKTFQPVDLWAWLLKFAVILFPIDVGVRRIQLDWKEWLKATANLRRLLFFWGRRDRQTGTDEALASLLARRDEARQSFQRDRPSAPDSPPLPAGKNGGRIFRQAKRCRRGQAG